MQYATLKVRVKAKSYKPFKKDITTTVIIPVWLVGSRSLKKHLNTPQPSIRAASSNDTGMLLKYGRRVTTINGTEPEATAMAGAQYVPKRFRLLKVRYIGVSITEAGSIWVTRNVSIKGLVPLPETCPFHKLPGHRKSAKYPKRRRRTVRRFPVM